MAYDWEGVKTRRRHWLMAGAGIAALVMATLLLIWPTTGFSKTQDELDNEVIVACRQRMQDYDDYKSGRAPNASGTKLMEDLSICAQMTEQIQQRMMGQMK